MSSKLTALAPSVATRLVPIGVATVLVGYFMLVTRRRAVSQIVGLLLVDNGIALVTFLLTAGVPLIVELGSALDVLLVVVVLQVLVVNVKRPTRLGRARRDEGASRLMLAVLALAIPFFVGVLALAFSWRRWIGWGQRPFGRGRTRHRHRTLYCDVVLDTTLRPFVVALRADSLSSFMVVINWHRPLCSRPSKPSRVMEQEMAERTTTPRHAGNYVVLMQAFITCMLAAVLAANLGVLWVAIEATTIATTFLVSHHRTKRAFEASWKYVILCSVGIAFGVFRHPF